MSSHYPSWNRIPRSAPKTVVRVSSRADLGFDALEGTALPRGLGRSYGDCCLNDGGTLFDMTPMDRFVSFDAATGLLGCEAGVTLADILDVVVPKGWFLPTTPGTKFVTVGGAIANDVHGKNHHAAGTFGRFVESFELLRSDGTIRTCSLRENTELFRATIGGLGLTGVILKATIRLKKVPGPLIRAESVKFDRLEEFFDIAKESDGKFEHTVAWIDALARGKNLGRGIFMRGDHVEGASRPRQSHVKNPPFSVPFDFPGLALNNASIGAFNAVYFHRQRVKTSITTTPYESFFYPLDTIGNWNRIYGRRGFYQYQLVVPPDSARAVMKTVLEMISASRLASFLGVLKTFGNEDSPGLLSFPRAGVTLALDFPNAGNALLALFNALDAVVLDAGGALYPAKDTRMPPDAFRRSFPRWREFSSYVDPKLSSGFWRRINPS
jgi:FAD/FMN-containing dehydrogenase